jgi:hypothetical protein
MSWSREEALTDPAIVEPMKFLSEFRFSLKGIPIEIAVRLYQPVHSGKIVVRRSHDLVIEGLKQTAAEDCADDSAEGEVLHAAVNELICVYNAARAQGLQPNASWLKANADFR